MLLNCDNKGCFKSSNALYDKDSGEVICQECGNGITNVSEAMKRTLLSFGQIVRTEQRKGFLMACRSCNANRQIVLNQHGDTICKQCHTPIAVQKAFLAAMESTGSLERVHVEVAQGDEDGGDAPLPRARKVIRSTTKPKEPQKATAMADIDAQIAEATKKATAAKQAAKKATKKTTKKKATKRKKKTQKGE